MMEDRGHDPESWQAGEQSPSQEPPPSGPPPVPYQPPAGYRLQQQTNIKAVLALVFGIVGIVALPFVGSVLAVVFGHLARNEIAADPSQSGDGLALAGLVMGWVMLGLLALVLAIIVIAVLIAVIVFLVVLLIHIVLEDEENGGGPSFPPFVTEPHAHVSWAP